MQSEPPKITVYVPSHNYGRFLHQAVDSMLAQTCNDWEMILFNEGSTDDTAAIIDDYVAKNPDRMRAVHNDDAKGLVRCANQALEMARGRYVMRLDADDYLDENALLVLSHYLDTNTDTALVYPNYFYVDESGNFLRFENRKRVKDEVALPDLPAHGACTMVRKRILKAVGGYSEEINAQDGYDLWLKIVRNYPVGNVETPLFYYRQHEHSLSRDMTRILENRQRIKRMLTKKNEGAVAPRIVAVIPAKNSYAKHPDIAMRAIGGKPLIDHTVEAALATDIFSAVVVTTDDQGVADHCKSKWPDVHTFVREEALSHQDVWLSRVVYDAIRHMETGQDLHADVVATLSIHTPLRTPEQIIMALDTLVLYDADSVVSVIEDWNLHFRHGNSGLEVVNPGMLHKIRLEREALFLDSGAIKVAWRDVMTEEDMLGKKISHVVMSERDSLVASGEDNLWLIDTILESRKARP